MKTYIQIGANIGNDNFFEMMKSIEEPSTIHLFEPNENLHEELIKNYSPIQHHIIHIHNLGISTEKGEATLNIYGNSALSSLVNRKSHRQKRDEMTIRCEKFNDFCDTWEIKEIEYMSIDTEGLDYEILNSIDIVKVDIKEIVFEEWPYDADDLNEQFSTGGKFLIEEVLPKYKEYEMSEIILDHQRNYKLTKIC